MIAAVVQVSKLVWKLKTLRLSHSPTIIERLMASNDVVFVVLLFLLFPSLVQIKSQMQTRGKEES